MSRYSEPTEDGKKHYIVSLVRWGRDVDRLVLAKDAAQARYKALPRRGVGEFIRSTRRARPDEVAGSEAP